MPSKSPRPERPPVPKGLDRIGLVYNDTAHPGRVRLLADGANAVDTVMVDLTLGEAAELAHRLMIVVYQMGGRVTAKKERR